MNAITMKKSMAGVAVFGAAALVLAGCTPAADDDRFLACAVSDEASFQDNSFNEAVYDGLLQAESELDVRIAEAESNSAEDFAPNLQAMVDASCDVIFAVGFNLVADVNIASVNNPGVNFVTIDGYAEDPETANLKAVGYEMEESSYLAGYLAAAQSSTKVIGTSGGLQIDAVTDFMSGFYFGAQAWAADTGESVTVLGWDPAAGTGDFWGGFAPNDPVGKSIAASQLEQGADILFPVGGDQYGSTIEAIKESGVDAVMIGVDKDAAATLPEFADFILTSTEKRMGEATFNIIQEYAGNGTFNVEAYMGDLANSGTDLSPFYAFDDKVEQSVKDRLAELKQGIIDGTIDPLS